MRHSLLHTLGNAVWVARAERRRALPLLATHARLKAGELVGAREHGPGPRRGTVLGMPVFFHHHYYWLPHTGFQNVLVHAYRKAGPSAPR